MCFFEESFFCSPYPRIIEPDEKNYSVEKSVLTPGSGVSGCVDGWDSSGRALEGDTFGG